MSVSVVIPYREKPGEPWRDTVYAWACARWAYLLPDAEHVVADTGLEPFCHASSINHGAQHAHGDLLVIPDADTAVNAGTLRLALKAARAGGWALAARYCALTYPQTLEALYGDGLYTAELEEPLEPEWLGVERSFAGFLVIARDAFLELGGYDPRLWGWAPDDVAIAAKLDTLLEPCTRVPGAVFHLYHHRHLGDTYGVEGYHAKRDLAEAYNAARGDRDAMRRLVYG